MALQQRAGFVERDLCGQREAEGVAVRLETAAVHVRPNRVVVGDGFELCLCARAVAGREVARGDRAGRRHRPGGGRVVDEVHRRLGEVIRGVEGDRATIQQGEVEVTRVVHHVGGATRRQAIGPRIEDQIAVLARVAGEGLDARAGLIRRHFAVAAIILEVDRTLDERRLVLTKGVVRRVEGHRAGVRFWI